MDDNMTVLRALMPQGLVVSVQVVTLGDEAEATNYTYEGSGSLPVVVELHFQEVVAADHVFGQVQYALELCSRPPCASDVSPHCVVPPSS